MAGERVQHNSACYGSGNPTSCCEKGPSFTAVVNVNWFTFLKNRKLEIKLPYGSKTPFVSLYPQRP